MQKVVHNLKIFEGHVAWNEVRLICEDIRKKGFEAFLAGGCVRDLVMGRIPKDFDIATNAPPEEILSIYPDTLDVGREFGVSILAYEAFQIEIASFRKDGPYLDGRRPSSVSFTTAEEDALRRDFTVNALFLDIDTQEIIDYVGGLEDIQAKVIRAVGDPQLRFSEDKLRMLRALRFSSQLEFEIEGETMLAIQKLHQSIQQVSSERIKDELTKWLTTSNLRPCLNGLWSTGLLRSLHPSFEKLFDQKSYDQTSSFFSKDLSSFQIITKFCLFFSFIIQKNQTDEFEILKQTLKDLKFSNDQYAVIHWTLTNYFKLLGFKNLRLSDQIEMCANVSFCILEEFTSLFNPQLSKALAVDLRHLKTEYLVDGTLPKALIDGESLKALGLKPGREMGELLKEIFRLQLEKKILSSDEALNFAKMKLT